MRDADHLNQRRFGGLHAKALPDGILIRPVPLGHGLVDNRHQRRCFGVRIAKGPTVHNGNPHCVKVRRADRVVPDRRSLLVGINRASLDVDGVSASHQSQRRAERQAGRLHLRPGPYPPFKFAVEVDGSLLVVAHPLGIHSCVQEMIRDKAEVQALGALEAANEQSRGHQ